MKGGMRLPDMLIEGDDGEDGKGGSVIERVTLLK